MSASPLGLSSWIRPNESSIPVHAASATGRHVRLLYNADAWSKLHDGQWKNNGNDRRTESEILASSKLQFPLPYHPYVSRSPVRLELPARFDPVRNPRDGSARKVLVPNGATPNRNADGHMVVVQPDGYRLETYSTIILSNGDVVCLTYKLTDSVHGLGDGWQNGVTASMIPLYAGLVTEAELGRGRIDHALKLVVPAALLNPQAVYPAAAFDRGAWRETPHYSGLVPMGAQLGFKPGLRVEGLQLRSKLGRTIAEALAVYGGIVTDRGGEGITIVTERIANPPSPTADELHDMRVIKDQLVRIQ